MSPNVSLMFNSKTKDAFVIDDFKFGDAQDSTGKYGYDVFYTFAVLYLDLVNQVRIEGYLSRDGFIKIKKDLSKWFRRIYLDMDVLGNNGNYVLKDIQQRKKIADTILLEKIVKFALVHTGNLLSPKKICDTFVSSGRKTSSATIDNCLSALCETYLFYKLNRYDIRGKETLKTLEKYYAVDMGLRFFMLGARGGDEGHILENLVFLELLRRL